MAAPSAASTSVSASPTQYPAEGALLDVGGDAAMQLLSADQKIAELEAMLHGQRQEKLGARVRGALPMRRKPSLAPARQNLGPRMGGT